jgi:hypothetical protein
MAKIIRGGGIQHLPRTQSLELSAFFRRQHFCSYFLTLEICSLHLTVFILFFFVAGNICTTKKA